MLTHLKNELASLKNHIKDLDRKVLTIFLSLGILQTISWYITSRKFFRANLFEYYQFHPQVYLIEYLYWFIGDFVTFFVLPVIIIRFFFKEKLSSYGLQIGDYKIGLKITLVFILIMLSLVWFVSATNSFANVYPHLQSARESWTIFFIFELGLFVYMIAWEFIWRGFMLFGLYEKFGFYSIFIQMIPFVILHNGKPMLETFGAILAGLALGILALRTKSIFYCVIAHMSVMFSIDLISSLRYRANDFGVGFSSLMNIIKTLFS
ncbi:MAG: CPBP family intramembrane metalloprotease [Ignavibacteriaceae bacterium]|nr:CPBP family intramembrane metalloprotease [Ignavibacteriaceae bacterium]